MTDLNYSDSGVANDNAIQRAVTKATGQTSPVDPGFQSMVVTALLKKGLDISAISPQVLNGIVTKLWQDPVTLDAWDAENNLDPTDPNFISAAQFESRIDSALFSPSNSPDPALAKLGTGLLTSQGKALSSEQQAFVLTGTGNASDVRNIIIQVATQLGVDPSLALAVADQESGLNPNAIGDSGHSVGLFQLHDQGEGAGMSVADRQDPRRNAIIALTQIAAVAKDHPDWSPGQVAAAAQRPADQVGYAASVDAIYGEIKGGKLPTPKYGAALGQAGVDALSAQYPGVQSQFESYFGRRPTFSEFSSLIGLDPQQLTERLRSMPSHISGMTIGQYDDLRKLADSTMQTLLGHPATDGIVRELFNAGHVTHGEVLHTLNHLSESALAKMDAKTYNTIYAANQPAMQGIYGEQGFDPRIAVAQHSAAVTQSADSEGQVANVDAAAAAEQSPVLESLMARGHGNQATDGSEAAAAWPPNTPGPPGQPMSQSRDQRGAFA